MLSHTVLNSIIMQYHAYRNYYTGRPWVRDTFTTRDKMLVPMVSAIEGFYCMKQLGEQQRLSN